MNSENCHKFVVLLLNSRGYLYTLGKLSSHSLCCGPFHCNLCLGWSNTSVCWGLVWCLPLCRLYLDVSSQVCQFLVSHCLSADSALSQIYGLLLSLVQCVVCQQKCMYIYISVVFGKNINVVTWTYVNIHGNAFPEGCTQWLHFITPLPQLGDKNDWQVGTLSLQFTALCCNTTATVHLRWDLNKDSYIFLGICFPDIFYDSFIQNQVQLKLRQYTFT